MIFSVSSYLSINKETDSKIILLSLGAIEHMFSDLI